MTAEIKKRHDEKKQRILDAIALKEPDRVPIAPAPELFPVYNAGYTVAEVVYDTTLEKCKKAIVKYLTEFDPDIGSGIGFINAGQGPIMELTGTKTMRWAGMPGNPIGDDSLQQFIEFPLLLDDEFDEFFTDRTGWSIRKATPRGYSLLEPLAELAQGGSGAGLSPQFVAHIFSKPEFRDMIEKLWKLNELSEAYNKRAAEVNAEIAELGFPFTESGMALVPYDMYSDFLRGTELTFEDLFERPEAIERFIDELIEPVIARVLSMKPEGKRVFMALHKGMDGFLSPEQYRKFYWSHLRRIIIAIIESGNIPYIYTEGKYDTRIDCLTEVPPGKVHYHFEDVDMAAAKKKLGGIACIAGGFNASLLDWSTPDKVRDEVKRLIDICAPGGGFIFEAGCGIGNAKRENVEAMFETVREYGKY